MIHFTKDRVRWELVPDFQPVLDRLLADTGTVIKESPTKLITRHDFTGKPIYLKRYRNGSRALKYYFHETEARHEWNLAQQAIQRGLPVVRYLAVGERWSAFGCQESLIITEGFEGIRLDQFAGKTGDACQTALAKLVRQMHETGVYQSDLHHNILVQPEPLTLCRIDVDRGEMKNGPLTEEERIETLAYINVFVPLLDKFFAVYQASTEFRAAVMKRSRVRRRKLIERRAARCVARNLWFDRRSFGGMSWWVRREFLDDRLKRLLENPAVAVPGFVVRSYSTGHAACRAYRHAFHLELLEIPTPRPIAVSRYLITAEIPGATNRSMDVEIARRAGRLLAQLHANGFRHPQWQPGDLVADVTGIVYLVGLAGLEYQKVVTPEAAAADRERWASQFSNVTDRAAFDDAYANASSGK
ncbi:MAG: hypothetical protein PCFJNLEI_03480 [Verrucomicrobiae bacterium]|nr:hypothetical protein [Verrucomicrobiae bacterium]